MKFHVAEINNFINNFHRREKLAQLGLIALKEVRIPA